MLGSVVATVVFTVVVIALVRFGQTMLFYREEAKKAERDVKAKQPPLTKTVVRARILEDQWEMIVDRLGRAVAEEDEDDGSTSAAILNMSKAKPRKCIGEISLAIDRRYGEKDEVRVIPLLRETRARLAELGFRVTEDGKWAVYNDDVDEKEYAT